MVVCVYNENVGFRFVDKKINNHISFIQYIESLQKQTIFFLILVTIGSLLLVIFALL